jgi:hypothetical protein
MRASEIVLEMDLDGGWDALPADGPGLCCNQISMKDGPGGPITIQHWRMGDDRIGAWTTGLVAIDVLVGLKPIDVIVPTA